MFTEATYPVHTKYIVADFTNGKEIYNRIKHELNVPVGILGWFFQLLVMKYTHSTHLYVHFSWNDRSNKLAAVSVCVRL